MRRTKFSEILRYEQITKSQPDTRPSDNFKKKRTCWIVDFAVPVDHRVKLKEAKRRISTTTLLGDWKNCGTWKWRLYQLCSWYSHQRVKKGHVRLGNKRMRGDHPNYSIIEIGQNTEKIPGELRRLAVTQNSVRSHRLTLLLKSQKGIIIIII